VIVLADPPIITVQEAGPQTTVQDSGRSGQLRYGIPPSGPMDRVAFIVANRLVGNLDSAAALECTLVGPRLEMVSAGAIAVTGAAMPVTVNGREAPTWTTIPVRPGDIVRVGAVRAGVRGYLAFAGGIDVPLVLGSRSTYMRGRLGGLEGRALRKGDTLRLFPAATPVVRALTPTVELEEEPGLRVVLGPQAHRFTREGVAALLAHAYEMLPQSDRMGARLRGPAIAHEAGHDIISDGIALGSLQVPGDGQPIALLVDRQSTGGYTKVATICSFDIGRLGQVRPGQRVRFTAVSVAEAHTLLREAEATLARILV
jgi:antagonist of KipI